MSQWSHLYNDRKWRAKRAVQLRHEPLCRICKKLGRVTVATVADHIEPHHGDLGKFWGNELQSLCKCHHDVKTITEDGGLNSGAMPYPDWLPTPACPVVLVTGPPSAGKSTYAKAHAGPTDDVIDLDECFLEVSGTHGHTADRIHLGAAIRLRNKLLANLAGKRQGKALFIVSAPSQKERDWWVGRLNATPVHLEPSMDVCLERTALARRPFVRQWFHKAKLNDWAGVKAKQGSDENGNPIDSSHHWNA